MISVRRLSFFGLAFLPLLVLAACGDDDGLDTNYPPAGDDVFERTTATVEVELTLPDVSAVPVAGGPVEMIDIAGPMTVSRSDPFKGDGGLVTVDTEIVSMELKGQGSFGELIVRPHPDKRSQPVKGGVFMAAPYGDTLRPLRGSPIQGQG